MDLKNDFSKLPVRIQATVLRPDMLIGEIDREADQSLVIEMAVKIDAKNEQEKFAFVP